MAATWAHDLRNAINTVSTNAAVVQQLLRRGETHRAMAFNEEVVKACDRCRELLDQMPAESGED